MGSEERYSGAVLVMCCTTGPIVVECSFFFLQGDGVLASQFMCRWSEISVRRGLAVPGLQPGGFVGFWRKWGIWMFTTPPGSHHEGITSETI